MDRYLALSASAGSGKTFALSVRYISLLFLGVKPSTILALTFTNKSANEMKNRITTVLNNLQNQEDYLSQIVDNTGLSQKEILFNQPKIAQEFNNHEIAIETIDKFLSKILRGFCWYVGINQDFVIESDDKDIILKNFLGSLDSDEFNLLLDFAYSEDRKLHDVFALFYDLLDKQKEITIKEYKY